MSRIRMTRHRVGESTPGTHRHFERDALLVFCGINPFFEEATVGYASTLHPPYDYFRMRSLGEPYYSHRGRDSVRLVR